MSAQDNILIKGEIIKADKKISSKKVFEHLEIIKDCTVCLYKWALQKGNSYEFVYIALEMQDEISKLAAIISKIFVKNRDLS